MTRKKQQQPEAATYEAICPVPQYAAPAIYPPYPQRVEPHQNASARLLQDRNATVAEVSITQSSSYDFGAPLDFTFKATGSSKREQGDRFNARTGELLSLSRAYLNLSRQLYAAGKELIEPEPAPEFEAAMSVMDELVADMVLEDPTDEDVELAKAILEARVNFNAAQVREAEAKLNSQRYELALAEDEEPIPQEDLDAAVKAFNSAAEALNQVGNVLGQFV